MRPEGTAAEKLNALNLILLATIKPLLRKGLPEDEALDAGGPVTLASPWPRGSCCCPCQALLRLFIATSIFFPGRVNCREREAHLSVCVCVCVCVYSLRADCSDFIIIVMDGDGEVLIGKWRDWSTGQPGAGAPKEAGNQGVSELGWKKHLYSYFHQPLAEI